MRAIVYRGAGGTEVVELADVPEPIVDRQKILVQVGAAGLNRADVIQRKGGYPAPPGWPADIPGLEYAGRVVEVGPEATRWKVGDRVMGLVGGGAHAERIAVHQDEAIPVPGHLDDVAAAAIPEAWLTAYDALIVRARVAPGERVLIHAVGSGVGTAAVQLAKWLSTAVLGTSRTAEKLDRARALGMDLGIDSGVRPFRDQVDRPVDVILDFLGGPALADNLSLLAPRGRLVLLGTLQGGVAEKVDAGRILRNRLEIIGTVMRARGPVERIPLVRAFTERVLPGFDSAGGAGFVPIVGATFPVERVADAHAAMERNEVFGKIVLTW